MSPSAVPPSSSCLWRTSLSGSFYIIHHLQRKRNTGYFWVGQLERLNELALQIEHWYQAFWWQLLELEVGDIKHVVPEADCRRSEPSIKLVECAVGTTFLAVKHKSDYSVFGHLANVEALEVMMEGESSWICETSIGQRDHFFFACGV